MKLRRKVKALRKNSSKLRKILLSGLILLLFFGFGMYFYTHSPNKVEVIEGLSVDNMEKIELEKKIRQMVAGYPIEQMVPYIIEKDPKVAAFLISIAKKESNWGVHHPKYQGRDCFNYWGYKGPNRIGSGGHSCFNSRKEAVDIVSERIENLVYDQQLDTPAEMIVWKCGSSCYGHSSYGVRKWISDVNYYYKQLQTRFYQR